MMRLKFHISFLIFSVVALLSLPLVPHHHHGSVICMAQDVCHGHDEGCAHDCGHAHDGAGGCVEKSTFMANNNDWHNDLAQPAAIDMLPLDDCMPQMAYVPIGILTADCVIPPQLESHARCAGLRAPPALA